MVRGPASRSPISGALSEAVWEARRIAITYDRDGIGVRRELEPLGLVLKAGIWYVVARVEEDHVRTYRVARVLAVEPLGEPFERPSAFDLAGYWAEFAGRVRARRARVSRSSSGFVPTGSITSDRRSATGSSPTRSTSRIPTRTAGCASGVRLDWPEEAPRRLLAAGRWVEVLEPAEVRARLADTARAIAARYAIDPG